MAGKVESELELGGIADFALVFLAAVAAAIIIRIFDGLITKVESTVISPPAAVGTLPANAAALAAANYATAAQRANVGSAVMAVPQ